MPSFIVDTCQLSILGLVEHLKFYGFNRRKIKIASEIDSIKVGIRTLCPRFVFISEDCFIHNEHSVGEIKRIINEHQSTVFVIFITAHNVKFDNYFYIARNVIVSSKRIKPETMSLFIAPYLQVGKNKLRVPPQKTLARLTFIETEILRMWMSGLNVKYISLWTSIKPKTISSHKPNIRKKINIYNVHAIYHYFRLSALLIGGAIQSMPFYRRILK